MRVKTMFACMMLILPVMTSRVRGISFDGVKGGTVAGKTITTLHDNDISATAASGWTFQTANASPSSYKGASCSVFGAGTYTKTGSFNFVNFTVVMWGRITASGPGTGPDTYHLSANRETTWYFIESANDRIIVPLGDAETYNAREFMASAGIGDKNSNWQYQRSGGSPINGDPGTSFTVPSSLTAGDYIITGSPVMWAEAVSDSKTLAVVEVASVSATYGTTTVPSTTDDPDENETLYVPVGASAFNVTATANPSGTWPDEKPTWTVNGSPSGTAGSATYSFNPTTAGPYTVAATCGTSTKAMKINVVEVDAIQYEQPSGTWNTISGTLYVLKGSNVTFKAIPNPGEIWPNGKPTWGGTSGASGSGETTSVTFNTPSTSSGDYKTVTAICGNTKTANIVVYDLTGTFTPEDNFDGRSQTRYGLEEEVGLNFTTDPAGVTAAQAGGLEWTWSGVGEVSNAGNDGNANYDAQHIAGEVTFRITVKSGPSKDQFKSYSKTVVAPSGSYMIQKPSSGIRHTTNTCSAGFLGWSFLEPKDVSFSKLSRREGTCTGTGTGFYAYINGDVHEVGSWWPVSTGNSSTGCRVLTDDQIYSGSKSSPYSNGEFNWPIPREYKADDGVPHQFTTATHNQVADANGKCTIQKHGAGPFSKNAADATSSW